MGGTIICVEGGLCDFVGGFVIGSFEGFREKFFLLSLSFGFSCLLRTLGGDGLS